MLRASPPHGRGGTASLSSSACLDLTKRRNGKTCRSFDGMLVVGERRVTATGRHRFVSERV